jgi:hypothetical protein
MIEEQVLETAVTDDGDWTMIHDGQRYEPEDASPSMSVSANSEDISRRIAQVDSSLTPLNVH